MAYDYVPWVCNFYDENPYEKINANATEIDEKIRNPDGQDISDPYNPVIAL